MVVDGSGNAQRLRAAVRYPDALPIAARRDELVAAIRDHQVVIVAGETGSGKSTQLPKLCLEAGRGEHGLIGHTQPRRMAARTIAERVAEELGTHVGEGVGYTVRFNDRVGDDTVVRVMTDGILLAELPRDRDLRRYDTLIIDEAHERSLNIDFILGYLAQLLPRRPELKVIVTSATIDTERFARHFAKDGVPAPIIEVTGRTYPVEVRYRPYGEAGRSRERQRADRRWGSGAQPPEKHGADAGDDRDQVQAVVDAVGELDGPGDVLVFLSGEREIHDTADALRRLELRGTDVLPLYARLSVAEQHRIFAPHAGRRVVLSTNVAETSLTVPGVRYVVDAGTARISRYSRRLKVQRLPIEPISQASANQRAGRCGRVAPGICIRLYDEEDFAARPAFTEPEILRTNLASVILQMTAIGLGDVAAFPFVEAPDAAAIRDGYLLLEELGAIHEPDERGIRQLTGIGRKLARLPVDPRLARMIVEAERLGAVRDVLVVAAALSIQDPRERPAEQRQQADELHRRFDVPGSDLLSIVALWDHLRAEQRARSSNQFRKMCRTEFLNYLRVREWQDLYSQLRHAAGSIGIRAGTETSHPDAVHRAVLAGLLSHLGTLDRDGRGYRGARGSSFVIANGSVLARRGPKWVMAAELVETNRLWARRVATIKPEWAERAGAHLVTRSYSEPRWDERGGRAVCSETVMLYGLPIVSARTVGYDRVDPAGARWLFIRHALVEGEWHTHHRFLEHNRDFIEGVGALEARVRRGHLLDEDALHAFYDRHVPPDVVSTRHFEAWWKRVADQSLLELTPADLRDASGQSIDLADYPDGWRQGDLVLPLSYRFDPGGPLDGVTVRVPLVAVNQLTDEGLDWSIPGYRRELVDALVRTLPKEHRRALIPAAETTAAAFERLGPPAGRLVDALATALSDVSGHPIPPDAFDAAAVPDHLRMHVIVVDDDGRVHDADTDLAAIRRRVASAARAAIAAASPIEERRGIVTWDVGDLPQVVETERGGVPVRAYPALLDTDDSVSLRVLTNADLQQRVMRGGVRRLLLLTVAPSTRAAERSLGRERLLAIGASELTLAELRADCVVAAVQRVLDDHELPWNEREFEDLQAAVRRDGPSIVADAMVAAGDVLVAATGIERALSGMVASSVHASVEDVRRHLARLVRPGFVLRAGTRRLPDVHRYVRGVRYRIDHVGEDVTRDRRRMTEVLPLEERLSAYLRRLGRTPAPTDAVELGWQLEELRVSTFAQPIGARGPVSAARVARALDALGA